jgi:hypothetical protein
MPTPLALSDEDIDVLHRLAAPIAWGQRQQFLQAVNDALASCPQPGPGVVYRTAREIQRSFTLGAQGETAIVAAPSGRAMNGPGSQKLHIVPVQIFLLVYSVQGWLEPRCSLAAAVSTALGGL